MVHDPLGVLEPAHGLARFPELRQDPGGGSEQDREPDGDVPGSDHRDPVLEHGMSPRPVTLHEMKDAAGRGGQAHGVGMMRGLGEPSGLGVVLMRLGKSPEFGQAQDQPVTVKDGSGGGAVKVLVDPIGRQCGEVVGGQLDHSLVVSPEVVSQLEMGGGEDAKSQVPETCDRLALSAEKRPAETYSCMNDFVIVSVDMKMRRVTAA